MFSFITDLLLDFVVSAVGPSSDRGVVAAFSVGSLALATATVWLAMTFADPISQPGWSLAVLAGTVLFGAGGLVLSLLLLRRSESDRLFGIVSSTINVVAIVTPLLWMIAHS